MNLASWLGAIILAATIVAVPAAAPAADCHWMQTESLVSGAVRIKWVYTCGDEATVGTAEAVIQSAPARDSDWDAVCVRTAIFVNRDPAAYCDLPPDSNPIVPATVTPGLVARAFRTLALPASELKVQPPNGRTLVNLETNFYTEQPRFTRHLRLLGRDVELEVWPSGFRWVYGDGGSSAGESAGAPYPRLLVTHDYARRGRVHPRVDTTYAARFRVSSGAWRPVAGTVTIPGRPVDLRVLTARPVLTGSR